MNVVGGVPLAGEADLAAHRPGPLNLVACPQGHQAVVGGGGEILGEMESPDTRRLLSLRGWGKTVVSGPEDGRLDGLGGQLHNDGCRLGRGGIPDPDPETLHDGVGKGGDRGQEGFLLGNVHDRLEDPVVDKFGRHFARWVSRVPFIIGDREIEYSDGEGPVPLLKMVELLLNGVQLREAILDVRLNRVEAGVHHLHFVEKRVHFCIDLVHAGQKSLELISRES